MTAIYFAARYSRNKEMRNYRDDLVREGHWVTSSWIEGGHEEIKEGGPESLDQRAHFAETDLRDLDKASIVISFTEEPRTATRGGRHAEFGFGLAQHKRMIVIGPVEHIFHELPQVERYKDWADFKAKAPSLHRYR
jgi:nucleoside 2-deoxyribosyltransferase